MCGMKVSILVEQLGIIVYARFINKITYENVVVISLNVLRFILLEAD